MKLSATFLMIEGADFHRSQGYGQKQGVGILLLKLPGALGMLACGRVTRAKRMASDQSSPPRLAMLPFYSSLSQLTVLLDWKERLELEITIKKGPEVSKCVLQEFDCGCLSDLTPLRQFYCPSAKQVNSHFLQARGMLRYFYFFHQKYTL